MTVSANWANMHLEFFTTVLGQVVSGSFRSTTFNLKRGGKVLAFGGAITTMSANVGGVAIRISQTSGAGLSFGIEINAFELVEMNNSGGNRNMATGCWVLIAN